MWLRLWTSFFIVLMLGTQASAQTVSYNNTTFTNYSQGVNPCINPLEMIVTVPPSGFTITDVNVRFLAQHFYRTDTNLTLVSPQGTSAALLTGGYTSGWDHYNVIFDDEAPIVVDTGTNAANIPLGATPAEVQSEGNALNAFDGEDPSGDWIFQICDVFSADNGQVREVGLIFEVPPAELTASKSVSVVPPNLYAVPGVDMSYTITVTNIGGGPTDVDSLFLVDELPSEVEFYTGAIGAGSDPVVFTQSGAGLSFNYATDIGYASAGAAPTSFTGCNHSLSGGYDANVSYICIAPKGALGAGDPDPQFTVTFQARIK